MKSVFSGGIRGLLLALPLVAAGAAQAQVVAIAGKNAGDMSKEQVAELFLGRSSTLPGGTTAVLIDQPESSPLREEFYSKVTGKSAAQAKSHWSKLAFTGKGSPPKEVANSAEVKKTVASTPGAIGYIEKSAVDGSVKVVLGGN